MLKTELKLDYTLNQQTEKVPVIVVAAGSSSRMQGANKQLLDLGDIPVIIRTLRAFEECGGISNIILVVKTEDLFQMQLLCEKYNISKLSDIVCGGATRQVSVLNGFKVLPSDTEKVLIHDGARPFVTNDIICSVIAALDDFDASGCAVKLKDTIKQIDQKNQVLRTVPREDLVAIQTPQGVWAKKYLEACENADITFFTDDTSIMEAAGYRVCVVEGSYKNIKITTKEDIVLAKSFLSEED